MRTNISAQDHDVLIKLSRAATKCFNLRTPRSIAIGKWLQRYGRILGEQGTNAFSNELANEINDPFVVNAVMIENTIAHRAARNIALSIVGASNVGITSNKRSLQSNC